MVAFSVFVFEDASVHPHAAQVGFTSAATVLRLVEYHFQESRNDVVLRRAGSSVIAERPGLAKDPAYILITVAAAVLCLWAWRVLRHMPRS